VDVLADRVGADVEAHFDLRLGLPLIDRRSVRILEAQVLHILGDHADFRSGVGAVRLAIVPIGKALLFGHFP
jgi:hypothetical protein